MIPLVVVNHTANWQIYVVLSMGSHSIYANSALYCIGIYREPRSRVLKPSLRTSSLSSSTSISDVIESNVFEADMMSCRRGADRFISVSKSTLIFFRFNGGIVSGLSLALAFSKSFSLCVRRLLNVRAPTVSLHLMCFDAQLEHDSPGFCMWHAMPFWLQLTHDACVILIRTPGMIFESIPYTASAFVSKFVALQCQLTPWRSSGN